MVWCYILLETYGPTSATAASVFWRNIFEPAFKSLPGHTLKREVRPDCRLVRSSSRQWKTLQSKAKWKCGHLAPDPSSSQLESWSDLCKGMIHSTAPKILRSIFWKKPRDTALSLRGFGPRRWGWRSRAAPKSPEARSTHWGDSSSGLTMNWKLLKIEISKRSTSWNGLLAEHTLS